MCDRIEQTDGKHVQERDGEGEMRVASHVEDCAAIQALSFALSASHALLLASQRPEVACSHFARAIRSLRHFGVSDIE